MPRTRPAYPPEFWQQMVQLVKAGRTAEELSKEFEPTAQTIHNWVKQYDLDAGVRSDGLTSPERGELRTLRREVKQLRIEREILKKPRPGSLRRPSQCLRSVRVHESQPGRVRRDKDVPSAGSLVQRLLRV
jgi:transposase